MLKQRLCRFVVNVRLYARHTVLKMPALSPTMTQGNLTRWRKKPGDAITAGQVLCDIETDKATMEFEAAEDSWMAAILVPEGTHAIPVGKVQAEIMAIPPMMVVNFV